MEEHQPPYDAARDGERRARQPLFYSADQLLGRAPIRLRRASDKRRLAVHLLMAVLLISLSAWWVLVPRLFAGAVMLALTADHGVHVGDLPSLLFLAVAVRSLLVARRMALPPRSLAPIQGARIKSR